ncbi:MAG: hypothetical protein KGI06_01455 [Candidatus Micrarchaeota archaeon]|nr:hypothetical protein [Candidatus Micrarchaeota archaeon]
MAESKFAQPKSKDWTKSLTSNPFIQKKLAERDPIEVMMSGADRKTGNFALLFSCIALSKHAEITGVLDTTSSAFQAAARSEVWNYWVKYPISSIKAQLRK